jgi:single-strand DNA-binding protein
MLLGNLTRDPELRYTPGGTAVCNFGLATNRRWTTSDGDEKEAAQFHRVVAWAQLAELCAQLLFKGAKVYVGGRIQYREWTGDDNIKRQTTEIVIDDMILLSSRDNAEKYEVEEGSKEQTEPEPPAEEESDTGEKSIEEEFEDQQKKDKEDKKDIPF